MAHAAGLDKMRTLSKQHFDLKRALKYEAQQEEQVLEELQAEKAIIRLFSAFSGSGRKISAPYAFQRFSAGVGTEMQAAFCTESIYVRMGDAKS